MCMFSSLVHSVAKTCIWFSRARARDDESKIFDTVFYSNKVEFKEDGTLPPVAMVLAVPCTDRSKLSFPQQQDVHAKPLMDAFHEAFKDPMKMYLGGNSYGMRGVTLSVKPLDVIDVGNYKVSFATSVNELALSDPSVFQWEPAFLASLLAAYATGYGFIFAKLQPNTKYHPFGYTYQVASETAPMFIPTLHIHPTLNPKTKTLNYTVHKIADDWDHEIYVTPLYAMLGQSMRFEIKPPGGSKIIHPPQASSTMNYISERVKMTSLVDTMMKELKVNVAVTRCMRIKGRSYNGDLEWKQPLVDDTYFMCDGPGCKTELRRGFFHCGKCKSLDMCSACMNKGACEGYSIDIYTQHIACHPMTCIQDDWQVMQRMAVQGL